jgi:hypothetical protein
LEDIDTLECSACNAEKPVEEFWDFDSDKLSEICKDCQKVKTLEECQADGELGPFDDENQEDHGDSFGEFIVCLNCRQQLHITAFPDGVRADDMTYCTDCQDVIDHSPVQPCAGGCGRYVKRDAVGGRCAEC